MEPHIGRQVTIRLANAGDAQRIAILSGQLGYPATEVEVLRRLDRIRRDKEHAVYVAEWSDGRVVGWVQVHVRKLLVAEPLGEIEGLVVDESCRSSGIGRLLLQRAERWARGKGCWASSVHSNIIRERAHAFYARIGYDVVKTQRVFRKLCR